MASRGVDPMVSVHAVEILVCGSSRDCRTKVRTRLKNGRKVRVIHKLDVAQVRWIIRQKRAGLANNVEIAESMGVSTRWIRKLWSRYGSTRPEDITYPPRMGRPPGGAGGPQGAFCGAVLLQGGRQDGSKAGGHD